jgi:hypothetical protein
MSAKKYRLITRADFDGVVSGALLHELEMIGEVVFAEPNAMQHGRVAVTGDDITVNLPYVDTAYLCLDHHASETDRVGERDNLVNDPKAPSAARVVYNYFGGAEIFQSISPEMLAAVDQADSAQYSEDDILAPGPWAMLNFVMDPRTGLDRFSDFAIPHKQFLKDMMMYCRHHPVEEILKIPDVAERVLFYAEHEERFELQIKKCSTVHANLVVVDLRNETPIFAGNRFTTYAVYPDCNISIQALPGAESGVTTFAVGKSILSRTSKTNVGRLMLEYGGGGHEAVGTCRVKDADAERVLAELVQRITQDG